MLARTSRLLRDATRISLIALLALLAQPAIIHARSNPAPGEIDAAALPKEAREVLVLIRAGGPFHFERDGVVFGNRERLLPAQARGHYHEYTVRTPRERSRGARRIVCGGPVKTPEACYYSSDHYQSFARIRE